MEEIERFEEGDIVVAVRNYGKYVIEGNLYKVTTNMECMGDIKVINKEGEDSWVAKELFRKDDEEYKEELNSVGHLRNIIDKVIIGEKIT